MVQANGRDLQRLGNWLESGAVRPSVDRTFALADVAEAHRYIETKRARGKVVLHIQSDPIQSEAATHNSTPRVP